MKYCMSGIITILLFSTHILLPADITRRGPHIQQPLLTPATRRSNSCTKVLKTGCCLLAALGGTIGGSIGFVKLVEPNGGSIIPPMPIPCEKVWVARVQLFADRCNNTGCPDGFEEVALCVQPNPDRYERFPVIEKDLRTLCPGAQLLYAAEVHVGHCKDDTEPIPPCKPLEPIMKRLNETCNPVKNSADSIILSLSKDLPSTREERLQKYHAKLQAFKKSRTRR